jgi:PAS domain S-box-containing protein
MEMKVKTGHKEELWQSQARIEASLAQFTEFFDFVPSSYLILQRDGVIHEINIAGVSLMGLERAELIGRNIRDFVAAENKPSFDAFLNEVFAGRHAKATYEVEFITSDSR